MGLHQYQLQRARQSRVWNPDSLEPWNAWPVCARIASSPLGDPTQSLCDSVLTQKMPSLPAWKVEDQRQTQTTESISDVLMDLTLY